MRKFLSLVAVFLISSTAWMSVHAEWYKGDQKIASQIHANDTIILAAASNGEAIGHYLDGIEIVGEFTQTTPFVVVDAGNSKFYLKQLSSGKYLGYSALGKANSDNDDGSTPALVDNTDKALAFTITDGTDNTATMQSPIDQTEWVQFGYSFTDADNAEAIHYIANFWGNLGTVKLWSYSDTAPWQVITATQVFNAQKVLTDLVSTYSQETQDFPTGSTDPGNYDATAVAAYQAALAEAQEFVNAEHSAEEWQTMLTKLTGARTALENSMVQITDGYYYIVNAYNGYFEQQNVYKAIYTDGSGLLKWGDLNEKKAGFIFNIKKVADGQYSVQSFGDDSFINTAAGTSANIPTSKTFITAQTFESLGGAEFLIANTANDQGYHTAGHGGGAGKSGNVVTWNSGKGSASAWKLRKIDNQALIDSLAIAKVQDVLDAQLSALIGEGQAAYDANFVYSPNLETPMVTNVTDDGLGQIFSNAPESTEGSYSNLIDKTDDGKPNYQTFFHSQWSGTGPNEDHYLQVDVKSFQEATPTQQFIFTWSRRLQNNANRPTKMTVYATNDTTGGGTWKAIKTIASGWPTAAADTTYTSAGIVMDQAYKYLRFTVSATSNGAQNNGHVFFTCSNFQMYPVTLDKVRSQYEATEGMKAAADALNALLKSNKDKPELHTATQGDIDALKAAIAAVKALYADTTEYVKLRKKAQNYVDSVVIGEDFGQLSNESLANELQSLIDEQKTTVDLNIPKKAQLSAAITALQTKMDAFLAGIKTIEPNKWYYIINAGKSSTYAYGKAIICNSKSLGGGTNFGGVNNGEDMYETNPYAMWRFVPIEGSKYYGVQNLGTGHFLGKFRGSGNANKPLTVNKPEPYAVEYLGKGQMIIVSKDSTNTNNTPLHAQNAGSALVNWEASINNPSAWTFKEVAAEQFDLQVVNHSLQIVTFPFDIDGGGTSLNGINGDMVKTYTVKNITNDGTSTTIDLVQTNEAFPAGTPFILEVEEEGGDSLLNILTQPKWEVSTVAKNANGLIGTLDGLTLNKAGFGYIAGNALNITTDSQVTIGGGSGYFTHEGVTEAAGEATKQLTSEGLINAIKTVNMSKGTVRVNVYTVDGKLVKSNVLSDDAKQGLGRGIYIIGKKKVAVK